jgi:hypothetical protein
MLRAARFAAFVFFLYALFLIVRSYVVHPESMLNLDYRGLIRLGALALSAYGCVVLGIGIIRRSEPSEIDSASDGTAPRIAGIAKVLETAFRKHPVLTVLVLTCPVVLVILLSVLSS